MCMNACVHACVHACVCVILILSFLHYRSAAKPERLRIQVSRISMADYEALHYDKDKLREAC